MEGQIDGVLDGWEDEEAEKVTGKWTAIQTDFATVRVGVFVCVTLREMA